MSKYETPDDLVQIVARWEAYAKRSRLGISPADWDRPCSGCANSASGAPYPGHSSGEAPCFICTRNKDRQKWIDAHSVRKSLLPGGSYGTPFWETQEPIDNYKTVEVMQAHRGQMRTYEGEVALLKERLDYIASLGEQIEWVSETLKTSNEDI